MGELLDARRRSANERLEALGGHLEEAKRLADDRVCVYLTGSFARGEAGFVR